MMGNLAYLLEDRGRIDEAAAMYREVIRVRERVTGGRDPETWSTYNNLAMLLQSQGKAAEAAGLFERVIALCDEQLPADHVYTALFRNNYGACLLDLGKLDDADAALRDSHAVLLATFGEGHPRVSKSLDRLAAMENRRASPGP
jgi:tetratricopeptide (TPR) repeat protein